MPEPSLDEEYKRAVISAEAARVKTERDKQKSQQTSGIGCAIIILVIVGFIMLGHLNGDKDSSPSEPSDSSASNTVKSPNWKTFSGTLPDGTFLKLDADLNSISGGPPQGVIAAITVRFSSDDIGDVMFMCPTSAQPQATVMVIPPDASTLPLPDEAGFVTNLRDYAMGIAIAGQYNPVEPGTPSAAIMAAVCGEDAQP